MRLFFKFFFFLSFFYLLHSLSVYINPIVVFDVIPSIFLISIYYIFFLKYKTSVVYIIAISVYYTIYDYIIGNVPFISITAFLFSVLLIEYLKKRSINKASLKNYLLAGSIFFLIKSILEHIFFGINVDFIHIFSQILIFNVLTTIFYISNEKDAQKHKILY